MYARPTLPAASNEPGPTRTRFGLPAFIRGDVRLRRIASGARLEEARDRGRRQLGKQLVLRALQEAPLEIGAGRAGTAGEHDERGQMRDARRAQLGRPRVEERDRGARPARL